MRGSKLILKCKINEKKIKKHSELEVGWMKSICEIV